MIARISGKVVQVSGSAVIVDVNGVGYEVLVPDSPNHPWQVGQEATLVIYHHVRENSDELFGFDSFEGKSLFEQLITVSGVGPKSALNVMALGPQDKIRQAIAAENSAFISGAAGIGQKSAQRICSELKDKVGVVGGQIVSDDILDDEALAALLSLGYSRQQAAQALVKVDRQLPSQDQVKQALKGLS